MTTIHELLGPEPGPIASPCHGPPIAFPSQDALTALLPAWLRDDLPDEPGSSKQGRSTSASGKARWALRAACGAVRVLCTLGLVLACAEAFFWPPMEACRIDQRGLQVRK